MLRSVTAPASFLVRLVGLPTANLTKANMSNNLPEPRIEIDGESWFTFHIGYDVGLRKFGFYIYALSFAHAEEMLAAIKASGRIEGQSIEFIDAGDDAEKLLSRTRILN
jgi:hypothetical protein